MNILGQKYLIEKVHEKDSLTSILTAIFSNVLNKNCVWKVIHFLFSLCSSAYNIRSHMTITKCIISYDICIIRHTSEEGFRLL